MLLDKHADVNGRAGDLHNPLQTAAYRWHREIVHILLSRGARINDGVGVRRTALRAASFRNHIPIVNDLLE
jgi:ankyrin repeat protein